MIGIDAFFFSIQLLAVWLVRSDSPNPSEIMNIE